MPELRQKWIIPEETHKAIVHGITDHLGFDRALSYELDDAGKLHARYGKGIDPRDSSYYGGKVPDPGEIFDWAIKEKKEQVVIDPQNDTRCNPDKVKQHKTLPFVVIPIERKGEIVTLISVNNWETGNEIVSQKVDSLKEYVSYQLELGVSLNARFVLETENIKKYLLEVKDYTSFT